MKDCLYDLHQDIPDLYTIKTFKKQRYENTD